jgi:Tol biopolymer transport system component
VSRCLEKKPEKRFQHVSDLGFALETLSDSSSTSIPAVPQPVSGRRRIWIAAAVVAILIGAFLVWWRQPPAVPVVEAVTQLTDDGEIKQSGRLVTDGSRIYFGEGTLGSFRIMQVAAAGGPTSIIPTRLANFQFTALSQDGSYLLGAAGDAFVLPFWAVPLPAGEPRRLGSIDAQDADLFPDGRILYCLGKDLYIAEKDGSQPRKLLSAGGVIGDPSVSPDGERLVFTTHSGGRPMSIYEARADGSGLHPIVNTSDAGHVCCARWTADGRYIVYQNRYEGRRDLWVLPMKAGFLQRSRHPVQLTNGPLSYRTTVASRDGKQIFAVGMKVRGELVRYDVNSKQFLPLLPGVQAFDPTFSRNGEWVAYTVYPDHTLWRSRSDGTEPLQLTFPPAQVFSPSISPDGRQVAYTTSAGAVRLISMDGGSPQTIAEKDFYRGANWSPDGNLLVFADFSGIHLFDLGTGKRSVVPGPEGLNFPRWVAEDTLVAATQDHKKLVVFDIKTQRWSDLVSSTATGYVVNWAHSPDYKYVYYTTGGAEPMAFRIRLADHVVETITSLKGLPRGVGPAGNTEISVAHDGSAVFTRNTGTQEIYAFTVKWP